MIRFKGEDYRCQMEVTLRLIGGKWKVLLLWHLGKNGVMRFNELCRLHPKLTPKMAAQQLRELEEDGIIDRRMFHQVPPKVEYSLTGQGKALIPVLAMMCAWGTDYLTAQGVVPGAGTCPSLRAAESEAMLGI
jgi:DNA-binding HxlR family transcriptional regulator